MRLHISSSSSVRTSSERRQARSSLRSARCRTRSSLRSSLACRASLASRAWSSWSRVRSRASISDRYMIDLCIVCVVCVMWVSHCVRFAGQACAVRPPARRLRLGSLLVGALAGLLGGLGHRGVLLARTATRALARDDRAAQEQFPAPDAPRLAPLKCPLKAADPRPAALAERLRRLHVRRSLGEEQFPALGAGKVQAIRHADVEERRDAGSVHDRGVLNHADRLAPGLDCLEPRRACRARGGIGPLHRCHPLSLAGPEVLFRGTGPREITSPRTLCLSPPPPSA